MKARTSLAALALTLPLCGCFIDNAVDTPTTQATVEAVKGGIVNATAEELATPWPREQKPGNLAELQRKTYTEFENTMGFGGGRMIPPPGHQLPSRYVGSGTSLDFTKATMPDTSRGRWKVENIQLIGTMHDPNGVAYDTKKDDWHRITSATLAASRAPKEQSPTGHALPVRKLNEFEKESLATMREGGNLQYRIDGDRIRVVGAIRAMNAGCVNCHSIEKGSLMGAFTYELRRMGKDEAEKDAAAEANPVP